MARAEREQGGAIFPKLAGGPGGMSPEQVAGHQRGRLMGAMVEAVERHGYASTTVRELTTLAGVSNSTFYRHFESKEECFLLTFDTIVDRLLARTTRAFNSRRELRDRFVAALRTIMALAIEEPAAAHLASVESLVLGAAGAAHREREARILEAMIAEGLAASPSEHEASEHTIRAVAAGIRGVIYRRIRAGRSAELAGLVEPLVDWGLAQRAPASEAARLAAAAAGRPAPPPPPPLDPDLPDWEEPPDSGRSRVALSQRERIVRATARLASERGFAALSVPAISAVAGVSNQTFYEHFSGKRHAFLTAFDQIALEALRVTKAAFSSAGDDPAAIGVGIRALLEHIARHDAHARLVFFALPEAGPVALDNADAMLDTAVSFVEPGLAPSQLGTTPPRPILEALSSGIWEVIQFELARSRPDSLPRLAPDLARLTAMSFG